MKTKREIGSDAESRAAWFYRRRLFRIIARNWTCKGGELDLVVKRGALVVFVEVRSRGAGSLGTAAESIDAAKRSRLVEAARKFVLENGLEAATIRFDVVTFDTSISRPALRCYRDAFRPEADPRKPWKYRR